MTHGGNEVAGAAGAATAAGRPASGSAASNSPAWAPLGQRAFRWLWVGVLISSVGTNMQTVGAQWLLVDAPNAAALVALVQTANTLPVMLLALAGGVPVVFALNATSVVFLALALLFWRPPPPEAASARERFVPALRAGGRYVWHEPVVRRFLLRAILFVAPGTALWALLPIVASRRLGLAADGYGALFGALGIGANVGALLLGRARPSPNGTLAVGGGLYAAALAAVGVVHSFPAALVALAFAGLAWMAVTSTLQAELQLVLPAWVRARGLAIYTVTFMGSQAAGALLLGLAANRVGVQPAV